ncbi:putative tail protein [Bajunvirus bajun]|uniref:Tail protein n=1 Tax=Brevundimonas phage vB_BgoS-Bajun TaxID=2948594 RepID=A0A9E7N4T5_9CAUD|nr:putative tail protein [Brevundimonas phage vB_BgoS-Bajun]
MADPFSFAIATVAQIGIGYLFPSEGPRLKDLKVSASTYGAAIPEVFGTCRVGANMIWSAPIEERKRKRSGKGGGAYNEYTYYCSFAMALCKGPVSMVRRLWADGKLIYDATGASEGLQSGKIRLRIYNGTEDQMPDALIERLSAGGKQNQLIPAPPGDQITLYKNGNYGSKALTYSTSIADMNKTGQGLNDGASSIKTVGPWEVFEHADFKGASTVINGDVPDLGAIGFNDKISSFRPANDYAASGNVPAYRDLCYVVFEDMPLADFGGRLPQIAAEVFADATGGGTQGVPTTIEVASKDEAHPLDGYQSDFLADNDRGYIYVRSTSPDGLRRIRMSDGTEDRQVLASQMGFSLDPTNVYDRATVGPLLCVTQDGSILAFKGGSNNYNAVVKIDPISLQVVGQYSRNHPFSGGPALNGRYSAASGPYVAFYGRVGYGPGQVHILDENLGLQGPPFTADLGSPAGIVGRNDGTPVFYAFDNAEATSTTGATGLRIVRLDPTKSELSELVSFTPDDFGIPTPTMMCQSAHYDPSDGGVLLHLRAGSGFGASYLAKFSFDTMSLTWTGAYPVSLNTRFVSPRILSGEFAWVNDDTLYAISTISGAFIDRDADLYVDPEDDANDPAFDDGAAGVPIDGINGVAVSYESYDSLRNSVICFGSGTPAIIRTGAAATPGTTLGWVVEQMLRKGGLTNKNFDLTALYTIPIRGYGWASGTDIKSILDELSRVFLFDLFESNGKLKARLRGDETVTVFSQDITEISQDLLGSTSAETMDFWKETRMSEQDLPERVSMTYMNVDDDFEVSTAQSQRISEPIPTMFSRQQVSMQINLVLTPTEAKNMVNRMLYSQWSERTKHETRLPWAYLNLDPADLIKVKLNDGRAYVERIHQTEFGANFSIEAETYGQDSGSYESEAVGEGGGSGRVDVIYLTKPAQAFVLNTPLLRDQDDSGGGFSRYYTAVGTAAPGVFQGAGVFRSITGQDYDELYAETTEVEWGVLAGALPPAPHGAFALDWESTVKLFPGSGGFELESITDDELWAGGNLCVIGDEVIQFRDAQQEEDGSWTLRTLARARRGTEYAHDKHKNGERFIFLSSETVESQGDLVDSRGQDRYFKAVGTGRTVSDAQALKINYEPRDLMPYAITDLRRTIDTVTPAITFTWARRTRLGGNLLDETGDVPLNEAFERYEVYVLNEPFSGDASRGRAPDSYKRMTVVEGPTWTYSAADMTTDNVAILDTLHVVVYQISAAVGRGFPTARTIEPWREW